MDQDFEPLAIYEAKRPAVERELQRPGSRARNEQGKLAVSKFKAMQTDGRFAAAADARRGVTNFTACAWGSARALPRVMGRRRPPRGNRAP